MSKSILLFMLAALAEIIGCFAFWIWLKDNRSILWLPIGIICLISFAYLLTRTDITLAGRAYAAYGGIYIVASLAWLLIVEGTRPDQWDMIGASLALVGTIVILIGHLAK